MEHQVPKRPYRVTDSLRRGRKGIAASSYENIMQQYKLQKKIFSLMREKLYTVLLGHVHCHGFIPYKSRIMILRIANFYIQSGKVADRFQFSQMFLKLLVEDDGTEIDAEFFELLPSNTHLMVIKAGEEWNPEPQPSTSQSAEPCLNNESQRVNEMVGKIRKAEVGSKRTVSQNVTTYIGWLHYCYLNAKYVMVKNTKKQQNVGPRPVVLSRNIAEEQLMTLLRKTFFTRGRSVKGMASNMEFAFGNVKGIQIADISDLLSMNKPHIYLLSKEKIPDMAVYSSDSDELMDPQMTTSATGYTPQYTSPNAMIMHGASSSLGTPNFSLNSTAQPPPVQQSMCTLSTICNTPVLSRQGTSRWNESGTPEVCLNSRNKCCICYDMDINAFLVPCAHKFCFPCATRVKTTGQPCPICRTDITNVGSLVSSDM
ncbi:unnamed protein product [Mytilus coruscus]|uniref:RING-type domain-containing protein n=1 Tax=Mytilus coruscus TaxID=42192 RepID=A0A6J8AW66_MYTCO|nr:unnamed protein product [Mytilus coruscus]